MLEPSTTLCHNQHYKQIIYCFGTGPPPFLPSAGCLSSFKIITVVSIWNLIFKNKTIYSFNLGAPIVFQELLHLDDKWSNTKLLPNTVGHSNGGWCVLPAISYHRNNGFHSVPSCWKFGRKFIVQSLQLSGWPTSQATASVRKLFVKRSISFLSTFCSPIFFAHIFLLEVSLSSIYIFSLFCSSSTITALLLPSFVPTSSILRWVIRLLHLFFSLLSISS